MRILNLYAGIGGNRKLWGDKHEVTAIEIDPKIALIYLDNFPNDRVIIADAHNYLLEHFREFDFIWSSPPCVSHSNMTKLCGLSDHFGTGNHKKKPKFPDMQLYEEIIFLQHYFKGLWLIENVAPYYEPLIKAQKLQRHLFWSNFEISKIKVKHDNIKWGRIKEWEKKFDFDLSGYKGVDKRKLLRNCVDPKLGLHILNCAINKNENPA